MRTIEFEWDGDKVTINEDQAFRFVDAIEEHATIGQLSAMQADVRAIRFGLLAKAMTAVLIEAGFKVDPGATHKKLVAGMRDGGVEDSVTQALEVVNWLLSVLLDGFDPQPDSEESDEGKPAAPAS